MSLPIGDKGAHQGRHDGCRSHRNDPWSRSRDEPALEDMLGDPIVASMMARDGVARHELMDLILALRYAAWRRRHPDPR